MIKLSPETIDPLGKTITSTFYFSACNGKFVLTPVVFGVLRERGMCLL